MDSESMARYRELEKMENTERVLNKCGLTGWTERLDDFRYVFKFALRIIEENELEKSKNDDNWELGSSIEDQINEISKMLSNDGDQAEA